MEFISVFKHALMISFFVFVMMVIVDFFDMISNKRISSAIKGGSFGQYVIASFFGSTPGCLGSFMNVSLYVRGIISFGAIVGGMIATSGDEAFVMLSEFPGTAIMLFALLFVCGIVFGKISDKIVQYFGIPLADTCVNAYCEECNPDMHQHIGENPVFKISNLFANFKTLSFTRFLLLMFIASFAIMVASGNLGPLTWGWERITFLCLSLCIFFITAVVTEHYLHSHIWEHILKKHILRVFMWSFGALVFVHWGLHTWNLETFVKDHMWLVLVSGALISIIPESGPHLIFVMMFAQGLIPFSVLFTSSFVQDGHGMLPMLSYSVKDSILIKVFNLVFGLGLGSILFLMGV